MQPKSTKTRLLWDFARRISKFSVFFFLFVLLITYPGFSLTLQSNLIEAFINMWQSKQLLSSSFHWFKLKNTRKFFDIVLSATRLNSNCGRLALLLRPAAAAATHTTQLAHLLFIMNFNFLSVIVH